MKSRPNLETETPLVAQAVAEGVLEEAAVWLRTELPRNWVRQIAAQARRTYARHPHFRRLMRSPGNAGRDWLWAFARHWLATLIQEHDAQLYARLPADYARGEALEDATPAPHPDLTLRVRSALSIKGRGDTQSDVRAVEFRGVR